MPLKHDFDVDQYIKDKIENNHPKVVLRGDYDHMVEDQHVYSISKDTDSLNSVALSVIVSSQTLTDDELKSLADLRFKHAMEILFAEPKVK